MSVRTYKTTENNLLPTEFYLSQNYPNPFRETTTIKYCVPYKTRVKITIYNSERKMIIKLVDEVKEAGAYEVEFFLESNNIDSLNDETYFYCLEAGNYSNTKTMILNKNLVKEV